jgi:hypothetical protein
MNITQIEEVVKALAVDINNNEVNKDEFIYKLMAAYGHRKTTIGRIKSGERNLANVEGEVRAKRHIYFKQSESNNMLSDIDNMKKEPSVARDKIRFVIATDFNQFAALDTRTQVTLDIEFNELGKHFDFFLPWAGMEKAVYQGENPADVKAAEKMAKLFDLIKADNFSEENKDDSAALHNLNVFLTRLLFCFFAEDTGIFTQNQFSAALESHTKVDGSDIDSYLNRLFEVLNTSKETRGDLPDYLTNFEYVNGGLFTNSFNSPRFSTKSRKMLIECGSELDWSDINPDIFGSMIQAVVHPNQRGGMGMHYTSVTNIMKVIEPLFLNELYVEFENIEDNIDAKLKPSRLRKLHDRIADIKLFDPACGSGNFLIIAFKEIRKLEMEIIKRLQELDQNDNQDDLFGDVGLDSSFSRIKLSQFYGIELDDFAHEVAILSLWLAEHQMNVEFKAEFGDCEPSLPLKASATIKCGSALLIEWHSVCDRNGEIYLIGNPPYLGSTQQSDEQKLELKNVCGHFKSYKNLDYISCWFYLATLYIKDRNARAAFVSTNSVCQGEQISLLWPNILNENIEISFAHQSFKWKNNAKKNANVICIVLGLENKSNKVKKLFTELYSTEVDYINPYLTSGNAPIISKCPKPISWLPRMENGNKAVDGGNLIFSSEDKNQLVSQYPELSSNFRKLVGSKEFIRGETRWCLWIQDDEIEVLGKHPFVIQVMKKVQLVREKSRDSGANKLADIPYRFRDQRVPRKHSIIIPSVSSERREYIPAGFLDADSIVVAPNFAIFDSRPAILAIYMSKMHMSWVRITAGRLKTDYRYSSALCWNTFPVPVVEESVVNMLDELAFELINVIEAFPSMSLAKIYAPNEMPRQISEVHEKIDRAVDSVFTMRRLNSDEERLELLFKSYNEMTGGQNA